MRRAEVSMLTAEELRLRKRKRLRLLLALLLVLVLGLGGYFAGRPARNEIKAWQARRHAAKAFALIEQEKWPEARNAAVAAYQLRSSEPQALRAVARFLSRTRQQQALEFWDQLAKHKPLTREDRRDEAAIALVSGQLERCAAAVNQLLVNDGKEATPHDWLLTAQLRLQQGVLDKALDSLGRVIAHPDATARQQFQASLLQLQAARTGNAEFDQKNQTEAWQRLNDFAKRDDAVGLDALVLQAQRQLARSSPGGTSAVSSGDPSAVASESADGTAAVPPAATPAFPLADLIRRLESHPLAKAPQKLLAIDLQLQADPAEKEALVTRAISEWKDAEASQLAVLATWLNGKGQFQRNLDVISLERAIQSRELFLQHVDALGALGRWDEIKSLLDAERFPLDPVIQCMYLARCNAQLGNEAAAKNNWQRALEAAGGDVGKLMTLAEYAEKNGASETAGTAYDRVSTTAPKMRPAWQGRLRTTYASRATKRIHAVLAEMLKLWPNDSAIQNDEAYMRLLLLPNTGGTDAVPSQTSTDRTAPVPPIADISAEFIAIEKLAERLVQQNPASLPHRTLLALARLKQQRPVAAMQVYDGIAVDRAALTPSALAVHAAVLNANGGHDAARQQLAQVALERLLPEEQAGISHLRE